jgi:S1-C subfamily serine protease
MSSKAERPYRRFPRGRDEPPDPPPPTPKPPGIRARLRALARRSTPLAIGGLVALVAIALVGPLVASRPLTPAEVEEAIQRALASATPRPPAAVAAFEKVRPSVVELRARSAGNEQSRTVGSGVVLDEAGTILTSLHVFTASAPVSVRFADGTESTVSLLASVAEMDIAVLRPATPPAFPVPATLGSPGALRIGDEAFVVGHPFGVAGSLTVGSISGLDRTFQSPAHGRALEGLIQFDAAVNPGSSGGPLLNREGDVVGIVTGLVNPTGQNVFVGVGFAVPIDAAASAVGLPPE